MGKMLHEGWELKKTLASKISSGLIDHFYDTGMEQGAWGGKILGAGGGGCVLFIAPTHTHDAVRSALAETARKNDLAEFREIPLEFTQSGTEILFNDDHHHFRFA
jgi:D-glycero-alpha-D-manno-heptose-7-phosphate kinase